MQFLHQIQTIHDLQNLDAGIASITEFGMHPSASRQFHFPIHPPPFPRPDTLRTTSHPPVPESTERAVGPSPPPARTCRHCQISRTPWSDLQNCRQSAPTFPHKQGGGRTLSMTTDSGGGSPAILAGHHPSPPQGQPDTHTMHRRCCPMLPPRGLKPEREIRCAPLRGEPQPIVVSREASSMRSLACGAMVKRPARAGSP